MYDKRTIEFAQHEENRISCLEERVVSFSDDRSDNRDKLMRDYARVLYSSSFRRLQGKMQLLGIDSNKFNRNRLTHSLEVAQIARSIASDLNLKHTVVAETAALAHDIGNPPFGHAGEHLLNQLSVDVGGYEGNAQAFRILRSLEKKHYAYDGLNLNLRTMMAITKYFYLRENNNKKFLYDEDYYFLRQHLDKHNLNLTKTIDAQIMDLSDEIAYAAHDLEDALSSNMISLGEIIHEFKISDKFSSAYDTITEIAKKAQRTALKASSIDTSEEYSIILKKELTSRIVNTLCNDIAVVSNERGDEELGYRFHSKLAEGLKVLLFKAILRKKDIQLYETRGKKVIRGLFEVYTDDKFNNQNLLLPAELRQRKDHKIRLVVDHISGMMDAFAVQEYETYFGKGAADKLYE